MTADDLEHLEDLREQLSSLRIRLESLRSASVVSATNYSQTSVGGGTGDCVSRMICAVDDIEYSIGMLKSEGYGILREVEPQILQEVLALYYLEGLPSWAAVSRAMGKNRSYANDIYNNFKKQLDNPTTKCYN